MNSVILFSMFCASLTAEIYLLSWCQIRVSCLKIIWILFLFLSNSLSFSQNSCFNKGSFCPNLVPLWEWYRPTYIFLSISNQCLCSVMGFRGSVDSTRYCTEYYRLLPPTPILQTCGSIALLAVSVGYYICQ